MVAAAGAGFAGCAASCGAAACWADAGRCMPHASAAASIRQMVRLRQMLRAFSENIRRVCFIAHLLEIWRWRRRHAASRRRVRDRAGRTTVAARRHLLRVAAAGDREGLAGIRTWRHAGAVETDLTRRAAPRLRAFAERIVRLHRLIGAVAQTNRLHMIEGAAEMRARRTIAWEYLLVRIVEQRGPAWGHVGRAVTRHHRGAIAVGTRRVATNPHDPAAVRALLLLGMKLALVGRVDDDRMAKIVAAVVGNVLPRTRRAVANHRWYRMAVAGFADQIANSAQCGLNAGAERILDLSQGRMHRAPTLGGAQNRQGIGRDLV